MRCFSYLGDHPEVTMYGVTFRAGEPTDCGHIDPALQARLAYNNHFAEIIDGVEVLEALVPQVPTTEPKRRGRPPKAK